VEQLIIPQPKRSFDNGTAASEVMPEVYPFLTFRSFDNNALDRELSLPLQSEALLQPFAFLLHTL